MTEEYEEKISNKFQDNLNKRKNMAKSLKRTLDFTNMLDHTRKNMFALKIPESMFKELQVLAKNLYEDAGDGRNMLPVQGAHLRSIMEGGCPFGWAIAPDSALDYLKPKTKKKAVKTE